MAQIDMKIQRARVKVATFSTHRAENTFRPRRKSVALSKQPVVASTAKTGVGGMRTVFRTGSASSGVPPCVELTPAGVAEASWAVTPAAAAGKPSAALVGGVAAMAAPTAAAEAAAAAVAAVASAATAAAAVVVPAGAAATGSVAASTQNTGSHFYRAEGSDGVDGKRGKGGG